jgi:hypothetical protein
MAGGVKGGKSQALPSGYGITSGLEAFKYLYEMKPGGA